MAAGYSAGDLMRSLDRKFNAKAFAGSKFRVNRGPRAPSPKMGSGFGRQVGKSRDQSAAAIKAWVTRKGG